MISDDTITRTALAEALTEVCDVLDPAALAARLFAAAAREPEPEYEPGEIYWSPDGYRYMRLNGNPGACWMELHANGGTALRGSGRPEQPLRKLVPLPSAAEVEKALPAGWANGAEIAAAVVRLLNGGSDV